MLGTSRDFARVSQQAVDHQVRAGNDETAQVLARRVEPIDRRRGTHTHDAQRLAMQCMSTLAIVRRETRSWRWPIFMLVYMNALAYIVCLVIYQVGSRMVA